MEPVNRRVRLTLLVVLPALVWGCSPVDRSTSGPAAVPAVTSSPAAVPFLNAKAYAVARARLVDLEIKGKAPMTGYDRDRFGTEWSDAVGDFGWTRNGCDTRNDVLKRDLVEVTFKVGTNECKVLAGTLPYEPYTGERNRRFDATDEDYATDLDAEHVVALANAWVTGAFRWDEETRAAFANDPQVLMMVDPSANRQKGDGDAATWLPANKPYRCAYVSRQIAIKSSYALWVAPAEAEAMGRVLAGCS